MVTKRIGFAGAVLVVAAAQAHAGAVDAKLLDILLANGSITGAQHAELMTDLAAEAKVEAVAEPSGASESLERKEFTAYQQLTGWAAQTALRGDMRVRHEYTNIEDEPKFATEPPGASSSSGRDRDRQRLRARLGAFTQINPEVETGIQVATGGAADRRSTNQDLDAYFDKKSIWLDLGYIDYHPVDMPGLRLLGGKMKQPWMALGEIAWDADINPEGLAAQYSHTTGTTTLFGSAGYYTLKDNVDGDGVEWDNDLALYALQAGVSFDPVERIRLTLGASSYAFSNDRQQLGEDEPSIAMIANGNTTDEFGLYEVFGQMDVRELPLPLTLYGLYVRNAEADDYFDGEVQFTDGSEDTAWTLGLRTTVVGLALDYSYRDVQRNAVVGYFTESDFAAGFAGSRGHKLKAQYEILKNFNATVTWFLAESDVASRYNIDDAEVETLMLDLNAKF